MSACARLRQPPPPWSFTTSASARLVAPPEDSEPKGVAVAAQRGPRIEVELLPESHRDAGQCLDGALRELVLELEGARERPLRQRCDQGGVALDFQVEPVVADSQPQIAALEHIHDAAADRDALDLESGLFKEDAGSRTGFDRRVSPAVIEACAGGGEPSEEPQPVPDDRPGELPVELDHHTAGVVVDASIAGRAGVEQIVAGGGLDGSD